LDQTDGKKYIEHADTADDTSERWMQKEGHQRRKMRKEIVLLPKCGPWEIEQQGAHFETQHNDDCA